MGDYRPGLEAAAEASVQAPLAELAIAKAREPCPSWLAIGIWTWRTSREFLFGVSRIAYGVAVTSERLERIEGAEQSLPNWVGASFVCDFMLMKSA